MLKNLQHSLGQPNYDWNYQVMNWFLEQWSLPYAFTYTDSVTGKKVSTTTDPKNPLAIQVWMDVVILIISDITDIDAHNCQP